jgi:hypothetical protein
MMVEFNLLSISFLALSFFVIYLAIEYIFVKYRPDLKGLKRWTILTGLMNFKNTKNNSTTIPTYDIKKEHVSVSVE